MKRPSWSITWIQIPKIILFAINYGRNDMKISLRCVMICTNNAMLSKLFYHHYSRLISTTRIKLEIKRHFLIQISINLEMLELIYIFRMRFINEHFSISSKRRRCNVSMRKLNRYPQLWQAYPEEMKKFYNHWKNYVESLTNTERCEILNILKNFKTII